MLYDSGRSMTANSDVGANITGSWVDCRRAARTSFTFAVDTGGTGVTGTLYLEATDDPLQDAANVWRVVLPVGCLHISSSITTVTLSSGALALAVTTDAAFGVVVKDLPLFVRWSFTYSSGGSSPNTLNGYYSQFDA